MNEKIKEIALQAGGSHYPEVGGVLLEKFATLLIKECSKLNNRQSLELVGVVADVEQGEGFDYTCLSTVKAVRDYLADHSLEKHFGIK